MPCDKIYETMIFSFTFFYKKTSTLFYVTGCFIFIYVCIPCRGQKRALNHLKLEFQEVVNYHVGAGSQKPSVFGRSTSILYPTFSF